MISRKIFTKENLLKTLFELLLLSVGAFVFALSFPNFLYRWGFAPLAYITMIPVFIVVHRSGYIKSIIYGGIFGYISYAIFNYWLATFDPVAFVYVPIIYASYYLILFPALKLADSLFPRRGWILQVFIWVAYEYLRTKGFLGYSYGILGYTQYNFLSLIGIADITGVAGVSLIVILPSIIIGNALKNGWADFTANWRKWRGASITWLGLFLAFNIYGMAAKVDYSKSPVWRPALIQHNINSWRSGIEVFQEALGKLFTLSDEALKEKPDALIWSETAFVPSINYYMRTREERKRVEMVQQLYAFMKKADTPMFLGNNDLFITGDKRVNYNAVFQYGRGGVFKNKYYKMHLVPFTEWFPYQKEFPGLYKKILALQVNFYGQGHKYVVFDQDGIKLGPLVCFEDTFGYLSRGFVQRGADILMNLSNDSWSTAYACNIQHMSIAVFRTIENRRSMVRSTTGGFTTIIDPNGKRIASLEPFTEGYLIAKTPVYRGRTTIYTRFGNWFDVLALIISLAGLLGGASVKIWKYYKK